MRNGAAAPRPHQARNGHGHRTPKIPLTELFERTGASGTRYLVGRMGLLKLLIVPSGEVSRGNPVWQAYVFEGPHVTEEQRHLPEAVEDTQASIAQPDEVDDTPTGNWTV